MHNKERILKIEGSKDHITYKSRLIRMTPVFSMKILKARRMWRDKCSTKLERPHIPEYTAIPPKLSIIMDDKEKHSTIKPNLSSIYKSSSKEQLYKKSSSLKRLIIPKKT